MSWLGGSLSSLTGQLSNLTKDILTEGTEEVSDHVTELRLAQEKIKELDTVCVGQKIEIDRLKLLNRECEEKAEGSELQINRISTEYRSLLEDKEREVKALKHEIQEVRSSYVSPESQPAVLRLDSDNGFESVSYGTDEHDFSDNISMQHDINRLRNEVRQLQTECQHWKGLVQKQQTSEDGEALENREKESQLQKQIQELQQQLAQEKDTRQHELSALQDAQTHKISQMRKKHKEEISELKVKLQEMEWGSEGWETQLPEETASLKATINSLKEEITGLQSERENHLKQITSLSESLQEYQSELAVKQAHSLHLENQLKVAKEAIKQVEEDRDQVGSDLVDTKQRLLDQLDANHADTLEVLSDLRDVRQHLDMSAIERRNKLLLEKDKLINEMITSSKKKKELSSAVENLTELNESLRNETKSIVDEIGDSEQQKLTAGVMDSLEKETIMLREQNVGLQEQVALLEKALQNANSERMTNKLSVSTESDIPIGEDLVMVSSDTASLTSDFSEVSRRNVDLDEQVTTLKQQITSYETEIGQFEMLQSDWLSEKETLEGVLVELRSQLKVKENSLNVAEAKRGLLAVAKHEASLSSLPDLVDPTTSIEIMDETPVNDLNDMIEESGSGDSMAEIADEVVELDRKVGILTESNSQLEQERDLLIDEKTSLQQEIKDLKAKLHSYQSNKIEKSEQEKESPLLNDQLKEKEIELRNLMSEKEDLEKSISEVPELKLQLQQKEEEMESLVSSQREDISTLEKEIDELKKKLRGKNEEIVNLSLEKEEMMTSLEELDNQNQEAMNHLIQIKDQLAKSNEELKKKLTSSESAKQSLEEECEKLKSHHMMNQSAESSTSNELNHQIAELKDEISTLNQKLDKSSTVINKLEKECTSKEEETKEMKEKLTSSAEALNNLHMDKQELEEKVVKYKAEITSQSERLKAAREENSKLKQELNSSNVDKEKESVQTTSKDLSQEEIERLESEVDKLNADLENSKLQLKHKVEECETLQSHLKKAEEMLDEFNKSVECKDTEVVDLKAKLAQLEADELELKDKLQSALQDCKKLQKESDRKHEECESFSRHVHAMENEVQSLKSTIAEKDTELSKISSQSESQVTKVNELKESLQKTDSLIKELAEVKDLLEDTADKLHTKCEECQILTEKVEKLNNQAEESLTAVRNDYDAQLLSATGELVLVKEELANKTAEFERLDEALYSKDEEIHKITEEKHAIQKEIEHLKLQFDQVKESNESSIKDLQESQNSNETLSGENNRLKTELGSLDQKLSDQKQHYESYIKELKSVKENDTTSQQAEYNELLEKSHKKDMQISENEAKLNNLYAQLQDCEGELEATVEKHKSLQNDCDRYIQEITKLQKSIQTLSTENAALSESTKQQELMLEELQEQYDAVHVEKTSLENEVQEFSSQNHKLLEENKTEKDKLNAQIKELQDEVNSCKQKENTSQNEHEQYTQEKKSLSEMNTNMQSELQRHKQLITEKESHISELNHKIAELSNELQKESESIKSQDGTIKVLKDNCVQKDSDIANIKQKLSCALTFLNEEEVKSVENDESNLKGKDRAPVIENGEVEETIGKVEIKQMLGMKAPSEDVDFEHSNHKQDVIVEIERLQGQLKEKDNVISELQRNSASLLKMLDTKSKTQGDNSLIEMHELENEVRALKMEREQMMDVLNDKSRESSNARAEVQRLMNVLAAQKSALEKLQKDNQELNTKSQESGGAHIDDMQKETVKTLSRLIRDKDLEIESLTQKNQTLLSVLQESSSEGSQINALMTDKDNLTKQLAALQGEREQMIAYLNQKHQESVSYHAEVQRLTAVVNSENEKHERLKHEYETLVPQFEEKKQTLLKVQNELINYKQKYQELEVKTGQMIQQSESGETVDKTLYDSKLHEHNKLLERYQELMENVKEKEVKIQNMYQQVSDMEQNFRTCDSEKTSYKKQVDSFTFQIHGLQTEQGDLKAEIAQLKQQRDNAASECQQLKETNHKLTLHVQDRDFEVSSLQEKMRSITQMLQDQQGEKGQLEHVIQENDSTQKHIKQLTLERDQALLGLQQTQEQNSQLLNDIQSLKEREAKLNRELVRLRQHLIQIEEGYTKEALAAEEREKDLRTRLTVAEESALTSTSAAESANQHASHQLDSLQQQLHFVSQQRDQAYLQISSLQEQNQMYSSSMANLQMVLEEFQQEKERLVAEETERYMKEVKSLSEQVEKLTADLRYTKDQLEEASDGLEAASRLSEQLDRKEEALDALREEVQIRESGLKHAEDELRTLRSRNDDRVDKLVIKNLFLGYFTAPQNQRHVVLRTIGGVLLFTSEDFEKIEGKHSEGSGWVPGFLRFSGGQKPASPPTTPVRRSTVGAAPARSGDNSFSQMFVKFLERESSPPPPTVRLPAEEMVRDVQKQKETHKPAYNPFTAPRHVAMPTTSTPHTGQQTSQHILMSSTVSVSQTLPTFAAPTDSSLTPPGSGRNTPASTTSGAILKDVLNR